HSTMRLQRFLFAAFACAGLALAGGRAHWVVTWGASPAPQLAAEEQMRDAKLLFDNQTIREIAHISIGGDTVRVRLSNAYGKQTLEIGAAHIALRGKGSGVSAGSDRPLTFGGRASVAIPPNALVLSDPVKLNAAASSDLAVSLYLPKPAPAAGIHYAAQQ